MKYQCPVCLNDTLDKPYKRYSYDVCRMCGVEYGYDDAINEASDWSDEEWDTKADEQIAANHKKLRKIWQDAGSLNWWEESKKPNFTYGVKWFKEYWKAHPEEEKEWEDNLLSPFFEKGTKTLKSNKNLNKS